MSGSATLNRSAAFASIAAALLLLGLKGWAAWSTGSTAMLGSLADTALDLVASCATLAGVWIAAMPADDKHRFGHGKAEAIAALFQIVLISISALGIAARAIEQLVEGGRTQAAAEGIGVSLAAIAVTLALLAWQRHVVRRTGSLAIQTDSVHYSSDLLLNLAVIAALAIDQLAGIPAADPLFGLLIAGWLGWSAWTASQAALDQLMDHEWAPEKKERFLAVLARNPDITGVHDLRTRTSGNQDFVQFHVWVDPEMTLRDVHIVMDDMEARLRAEFPDTEIIIHPEPTGHVDEQGPAGEDVLPHTCDVGDHLATTREQGRA
ncbi:ferrous-iron efflux pump FieF [Novosphingobium chloroacetimidivorans]|uniref:Ferrous-iron efflux pump FieF n=1 Tax=Novosphingobium chloroacetimidivorans TaxID=1428314 RepID=A0A7W7NW38_9SPHN|nr:cation diffusion facilitator family transporter [Novosphingobium chloroacetimidivorans]MBB4857750.1 ferrous-iron efflux pump FieF [Novosphingobium chloroacetimidivorans]